MLQYFVFNLCLAVLVSPVKYIEDGHLTHEEFEAYPLVSRIERDSEACEGVREVEEVRNVAGEEMSRLTLVHMSIMHAVLEESKSKGRLEVWHRWVYPS